MSAPRYSSHAWVDRVKILTVVLAACLVASACASPTSPPSATPLVTPTVSPALTPTAAASATARPTGTPTATVPAATIARLIGQKLVVRMEGTTPSADLLGRIRRGEVGGIILFSFNITTPAALTRPDRRAQGRGRGGRPAAAPHRRGPGGRRDKPHQLGAADAVGAPDGARWPRGDRSGPGRQHRRRSRRAWASTSTWRPSRTSPLRARRSWSVTGGPSRQTRI